MKASCWTCVSPDCLEGMTSATASTPQSSSGRRTLRPPLLAHPSPARPAAPHLCTQRRPEVRQGSGLARGDCVSDGTSAHMLGVEAGSGVMSGAPAGRLWSWWRSAGHRCAGWRSPAQERCFSRSGTRQRGRAMASLVAALGRRGGHAVAAASVARRAVLQPRARWCAAPAAAPWGGARGHAQVRNTFFL